MDAQIVEGGTLDYVLVRPAGVADTAGYPLVVMLHGFGANMHDLASIAPALDATGYVYAFPNAPYSVQLGGGMEGFSWSLGRPGVEEPAAPENEPAIEERLDGFMSDVIKATGAERGRMVIGGFSQGAGVSLRYGLPRADAFAGIAVLSGFFRDAELVRPLLPARREQRIFIAHGRQDQMIAMAMAQQTKAFLEAEGYAPEFHEYDMTHSISEAELRDLAAWLHAH
jgi:phospholipase/carboxylesterase